MTSRANGTEITKHERGGWEIVRLRSRQLEVDVLPAKGGDILQVRWLPESMDLLWTSPWGLRQRGATPTAADSYANFMETYPGGWQTLFPNGGQEALVHGVLQPFHGEACIIPWNHEIRDRSIFMSTRLVRSPFALNKTVTVSETRVEVRETARNIGSEPFATMWCHHPAFGPPLLDEDCHIETAARTFIADEEMPSDVRAGQRSPWPHATAADGSVIDLRSVPAPGSGVARQGYLADFERGWAALVNPRLRLRAELSWDIDVLPYAWLWLEANASSGFPVYRSWYVLALEPASSYPARGLEAAGRSGTLLPFEPGESRTVRVALEVSRL